MTTVADLRVKFSADLGNVKNAIADVDNRLNALERGSRRAGGGLRDMFNIGAGNLLSSGIQAATRAVMGMGRAFVGGLASATMAASDLNAQISSIGAISNASGSDLAKIKELVNTLGIDPKLKVSSTEAASAIEMLVKNGLELPDVLNGAARATVLLANSTGADFATAADVATSAMSAFGISAEDMSQAVNGITSVTTNSKFDINDYRLAIAQAGGVAATVGVEFDDFNTTIAAISPLFGSGSDAGTSFKTMLQRLIPQSADAAALMKQLGLMTADGVNRFFDANGQLRDQAEIAGLLNSALGDLSEEQKNNALSTIFGTDAMRAAAGMANMTEQQYRDFKKTLGNTDAEKAAAMRMDNLAGDMEIFSGVMEALQVQIGDKFQPALRRLFQGITPIISEITPQLAGLVDHLSTAFLAPAIDGFIAKLNEVQALTNQVFTVTGDSTGTFLAGLAAFTGGTTTLDVAAKVVTVDWLSGGFTYTYDAEAQITETSVIWGLWTHTYDAKAQITENSVAWGLWTHSYNAKAEVDDNSILWGYATHTYDAKAKIAKNSILWGFVTTEVDATGRIVDTKIGADFKMPEIPAIIKPAPQTEKFLQSEKGQQMNFADRLAIRFAPGVLEAIEKFLSMNRAGGGTIAGAPLMTATAPKIEFPPLPEWTWPTLPIFTWPVLPEWSWPSLPVFAWPSLPDWSWPVLPEFTWPHLPTWSWPSIPAPGWLSALLSWSPSLPSWLGGASASGSTTSSGSIGNNAGGTSFWQGGLTWVGERGPELVSLPQGARIYNNRDSMALAGAGGGVNVTIQANVGNNIDLQSLAYQVADVVQRRRR